MIDGDRVILAPGGDDALIMAMAGGRLILRDGYLPGVDPPRARMVCLDVRGK